MRRLAILSLIVGFAGVIALFGLSFKARSESRAPDITGASWLASMAAASSISPRQPSRSAMTAR